MWDNSPELTFVDLSEDLPGDVEGSWEGVESILSVPAVTPGAPARKELVEALHWFNAGSCEESQP